MVKVAYEHELYQLNAEVDTGNTDLWGITPAVESWLLKTLGISVGLPMLKWPTHL